MAIRAIDLQLAILQGPLVAGNVQHAEVSPQQGMAFEEQQFASRLTERDESVHRLQRAEGNKVGMRMHPDSAEGRRSSKRGRSLPLTASQRLEENVFGSVPGSDDGSVIDVSA